VLAVEHRHVQVEWRDPTERGHELGLLINPQSRPGANRWEASRYFALTRDATCATVYRQSSNMGMLRRLDLVPLSLLGPRCATMTIGGW
jgi:hypothetical protein